jgi:hypothetical protein
MEFSGLKDKVMPSRDNRDGRRLRGPGNRRSGRDEIDLAPAKTVRASAALYGS